MFKFHKTVSLDTDRGRRGGLVAATSIASPLEERRSITKQSLSLDESAIIDSNLPSAERLAELQSEYSNNKLHFVMCYFVIYVIL